MKVGTVALSSMIQLTVSTPSLAAYCTPLSPSVVLSSDSGPIIVPSSPIVSSRTDLSIEENSTISNPQVAGPNLGICIAIPVVVLFVAGVILITSLIIILYARISIS